MTHDVVQAPAIAGACSTTSPPINDKEVSANIRTALAWRDAVDRADMEETTAANRHTLSLPATVSQHELAVIVEVCNKFYLRMSSPKRISLVNSGKLRAWTLGTVSSIN